MSHDEEVVPHGDAAAMLERWYVRRQAATSSALAPWERDAAFMALCLSMYPGDCELVSLGGYKSQGARQRLRYMYRGHNLLARAQERVQSIAHAIRVCLEEPVGQTIVVRDGLLARYDQSVLDALAWWIDDTDADGTEVPPEHAESLRAAHLIIDEDGSLALTSAGEAALAAMAGEEEEEEEEEDAA